MTRSWRSAGELERRLGGAPTPLVSRADGLVLVSAEDPAAALFGAVFTSSPGGIIRSACSTFLISRSWRSTARDGRPRRRRCSRWRRSTVSSCRTRRSQFAERVRSESGPAADDHAAWVERAFLLAFGAAASAAELRLCVRLASSGKPRCIGRRTGIATSRPTSERAPGPLPHAAVLE